MSQPDHYEQSSTDEEVTLPFEHPGDYEVCKEEETARVYPDIEIEALRLVVVFGAIVMLSNVTVDLITSTLRMSPRTVIDVAFNHDRRSWSVVGSTRSGIALEW